MKYFKILFGHHKHLAIRLLLFASTILFAMIFGMAAARFQLTPYPQFVSLYYFVFSPEPREEYEYVDPLSLASIDVARKRMELAYFLLGQYKLPQSLPSAIDEGITDARYSDITSLRSIDKITIAMEYNLESYVYHFIPVKRNGIVVLYHQGHRGDFYFGKKGNCDIS